MDLDRLISSAPRAAVLLTGANGYIGSRVLRSLSAAGVGVRRLARRPIGSAAGLVVGDVRDTDAVAEAVSGVSTVVHCAAYVGKVVKLHHDVNVGGTRNLLRAAERNGVRRVVYLSTSGVYGGQLGYGQREGEIPVSPQSSLSRSRRRAEELVLEAGGIVVRPHIVYGPGDRRVITALLGAMRQLNAWIGNPEARISTIPVEQLGRLVASLGFPGAESESGVYHAAWARPTRIRDVIIPIYEAAGVPLPRGSISPRRAEELYPAIAAWQFGMISRDNWFDSSRIWEVAQLAEPSTTMGPVARNYYRNVLLRPGSGGKSGAGERRASSDR